MNRLLITPPQCVAADISLPASKSICNRVLVMHALAGGTQPLSNLSDCDDTKVMVEALATLPQTIDIGAAGTAMRFLTAYLSTQTSSHILTGSERMQHRPIHLLVDALRSMGAEISYVKADGFPPLHIRGAALHGGEVVIDGGISSQFISALLLIAPALLQGLQLHLTNQIISRSYIDMTLKLMREFGADARWTENNLIVVRPSDYKDIPYSVESDWSAASYWYEIAALGKEVSLRLLHLRSDSYQGDSRVASVFEKLGVHTTFTSQGVILNKKGTQTTRFEDDFADIPDLAQTVVVTCAMLGVPFRISGLQTLKIKETDRIKALETELSKLGFVLEDKENGSILSWEGTRCTPLSSPSIATYEDHRMAMAFAPASLKFGEIRIENPAVVSKSYVNYWEHLRQVGFEITSIDK